MSNTPDYFALYLDAGTVAHNFHAAHVVAPFDKASATRRRDAAIEALEKVAASLGLELVPRVDVVTR